MICSRDESTNFLANFYHNVALAKADCQSPFFVAARDQLERFFDVLEARVASAASREAHLELAKDFFLLFSPNGSLLTTLLAAEQSVTFPLAREAIPAPLLREIESRRSYAQIHVNAKEYFFVRLMRLLARNRDNSLWRRTLLESLESSLGAVIARAPSFAPKAFFLFESFFVFPLDGVVEAKERVELVVSDSLIDIYRIYIEKYTEYLRSLYNGGKGTQSELSTQLRLYADKCVHFLRCLTLLAHGRALSWQNYLEVFKTAFEPTIDAAFLRVYISNCTAIYTESFPAFLNMCSAVFPFAEASDVLLYEKLLTFYNQQLLVERNFDLKCFFAPLSAFKENIHRAMRYWAAHIEMPGFRPFLMRIAAMAELGERFAELEEELERRPTEKQTILSRKSALPSVEPLNWNTIFDPHREYRFTFFVFLFVAKALDRIRSFKRSSPEAKSEAKGVYVFKNGVLVQLKNPMLGKRPPPITNLRFMAQKRVFWTFVVAALCLCFYRLRFAR